jgi:serine protease Do
MSTNRKSRTVTAITALGAVAITGAAAGVLSSKQLAASTVLTAPAKAVADSTLPASFSEIIDRVGPAVVSIRVTGRAPQGTAQMPEIPEPFKRFFGENFGFQFGNPGPGTPRRAPRVQGMGSGFFIDADGHVVTNNHVIGDADRIEIMMKDGETHEATLVGRDPKTDLALLKVTSDRRFPFVRFGKSADAKVGDWVIAQLKDKGAVSRGWLGVNIQQVTKDLAAGLGMKKPEGALVANVTEDSPAAKAGLKAGDVIVAFEG